MSSTDRVYHGAQLPALTILPAEQQGNAETLLRTLLPIAQRLATKTMVGSGKKAA